MEASTVNLPEGYSLDTPGVPEGYTLDEGPSILGAAGRGALDALPFGTKGAAAVEAGLGSGSYDSYLKELDSLLAADKEQQPIAHYGGEIAGSIAPFAIPGVGEALGAESLAGRAGVGAGIGALQAASNTRAPLTSTQGLEDVALGAGSGAVLNPALGALGDAVSSKLQGWAPKLEEVANKKAVQAANLDPKTLGLPADELQNYGQKLRDWDLVQGPTNERLLKAQVLLNKTGQQIGDIGAGAQPLQDASPFVENLSQKAEESSKFFGTEGNHDLATYRQGMANIQNNGKTFDALQKLKSAYGDKAFSHGEVADPANANVYRQIKAAMKSIIASSPEEYQSVMTDYGTLKDIQSGLMKQLQREQATGTQTKGFGMAGKMGGMILGGNPELTTGVAAALAPVHPFMAAGVASTMFTNPQLMAKTAGRLASALGKVNVGAAAAPSATNGIENLLTHPAMAQYKPMFQQATAGLKEPGEIQKKQTITDFVLSQRDPNYSEAKETASRELGQ